MWSIGRAFCPARAPLARHQRSAGGTRRQDGRNAIVDRLAELAEKRARRPAAVLGGRSKAGEVDAEGLLGIAVAEHDRFHIAALEGAVGVRGFDDSLSPEEV